MRPLILLATAALVVGCTGGPSEKDTVATDPKLQHLQNQIDREKEITADIEKGQEEGSKR